MSALAATLLATLGFGLIALTMPRHAGQAGLRPTIGLGRLRPAGWAALLLSFAISLTGANWRFAVVEWVGAIGLAAAIVVLTLLCAPRLLPKAMIVMGVVATAATIGVFAAI